jgi:tetratricopeptide (TPR) repeat protein
MPEMRQETIPEKRREIVPEEKQKTVWEDAGASEDVDAEAKVRRRVPVWVWAASVVVLLIAGFATWRIFVPTEFDKEERAGLEAIQSDKYDEVARHFAHAAAIEPTNPQALLYYGVAQAANYSPGGSQNGDNLAAANNAIATFEQVLALRPNDGYALNAIALLYYEIGELDASKKTLLRIVTIEPRDLEADYNIGVIDWMVAYRAVRERLSQEHQAFGKEGDYNVSPAACRALAESNRPVLADAMQHLNRVLEANPKDDDAMVYLNLVYRLRAGTHCGDMAARADKAARAADLAEAKTYLEKATATRLAARQSGSSKPRDDSPQPASTLSLPENIHIRLYRIPPPPPPPPSPHAQ